MTAPTEPPAAPLPLNPRLARWNQDSETMAWWGAIVADPRFDRVMDVMLEMGAPKGIDPASIPASDDVSLTTRMSLMMSQLTGYHASIRNLRTLAVPSTPQGVVSEPWDGPELKAQFESTRSNLQPT